MWHNACRSTALARPSMPPPAITVLLPQATAEARLCPLPEVSPQLSLPSSEQQRQQQQDQSAVAAAAPVLPRSPGQMLPLRKMPPAFVLILTPLAQFWKEHGGTLPLPADGVVPDSADMQACEQMATAVLAAKRGAAVGSRVQGMLRHQDRWPKGLHGREGTDT